MELLTPLKDELQQNYETVRSTAELIEQERDMLQGDIQQRIALYSLSTDVWQSVVNSGMLSDLGEAADPVATAYRDVHRINEVIEKFNQYGNRLVYTPMLKQVSDQYNREHIIDIIAQMCDETSMSLMDAQDALDTVIKTECPACGQRFPNRSAMKSHVTQKDDPEHEAVADRVI